MPINRQNTLEDTGSRNPKRVAEVLNVSTGAYWLRHSSLIKAQKNCRETRDVGRPSSCSAMRRNCHFYI